MAEVNVFTKLSELRTSLLSQHLKKTGENRYAGFSYFELTDFLPCVLKKMKEIGLIGIYSYDNGNAKLDIINTEKPEERIAFTCPFGGAQLKGCHEIQNIGACITYTRRYLWVIALEISEHDELDATSGDERPRASKQQISKPYASKPLAAAKQTPPKRDKTLTEKQRYQIASDAVASMQAAETFEQLKNAFGRGWVNASEDDRDILKDLYESRKAELNPGE